MTKFKKIILRWTPSFIKEPLLIYRRFADVNKRHLQLKTISQELIVERIRDVKVLPNRSALLEKMPKNAVVAEVGVADGLFSSEILLRCMPMKLHLIDLWAKGSENASYNDQAYKKIIEQFSEERTAGLVELHRALSWDALATFPDAYFDWVYIDACHTYESVYKDLRVAMRKVKPDGFICGHDYARWADALSRMGVIEAVNEFCNEYKYDMVYLTHEKNRMNSYALRQS